MERFMCCIFVVIFLLCFSSCEIKRNEISITPNDQKIIEAVSKTYNESELTAILNFAGTLNDLNDEYPAECIRENNEFFRVSYLGNGEVVVYDEEGNKIVGNLYQLACAKADLDKIKIGDSLEKVMSIDPNGSYPFLYTGRNDLPKESIHCTTDGFSYKV